MSNRLVIEVSIIPCQYDGEPLVLVLAADDFGNQFSRWSLDNFRKAFSCMEDLIEDVIYWDTFNDCWSINDNIEVLGFDETLEHINNINDLL